MSVSNNVLNLRMKHRKNNRTKHKVKQRLIVISNKAFVLVKLASTKMLMVPIIDVKCAINLV